jgi:hypothetical protein
MLYSAFEGVDVVFHTAAADPSKNDLQLHHKVNVEGEYYTRIIVTRTVGENMLSFTEIA